MNSNIDRYIKTGLVLSFILLISNATKAQFELEHYQLRNGLKVYLNYDPHANYVEGAVAIKSGAKYDPENATGISHYLEHMLFKGTQKLGTWNYEEESVFLDSIRLLYDKLSNVKNEASRDSIHKQINKYSLKAGRYAIPNEIDKLLDAMGAKKINAFTGFEQNAYFNRFPAEETEKWLKLYAHRFQNPVFRLFQSELETVYEEKNMYMDQFESVVIEEFFKHFYPEHPYGQNPILGKTEHIKNPSLTKMKEYYNKYYRAGNMALILSGNFDPDRIKEWIEEYFSKLPDGRPEDISIEKPGRISGRKVVTKRLTPVRAGLLAFRTVPYDHPDRLKIEVLHNLLTNNNQTGMLDKLGQNNDLLYSLAINDMRKDAGASVFLFVPKLIFQSFRKAENLVLDEIEKIKTGKYPEERLEAVKLNMKKDFEKKLENPQSRTQFLMNLFFYDEHWEKYLDRSEKIRAISKSDISEIARKYYGDDYFVFRSRMGFPNKDKLEKPGYEPVKPENPDERSEFANELAEVETEIAEPDFIYEGDDYKVSEDERFKLFHVQNPVNELFKISVRFKTGTDESPELNPLALYLNQCGTEKYPGNKFREELQKLGSSISFNAENNYFDISIEGLENQFEESLSLLNQILNEPHADKQSMKNILNIYRVEDKYEKRKPSIKAEALFEYVAFGENSDYLNNLSLKEVKNLDAEDMVKAGKSLREYPVNLHYSGIKEIDEVRDIIGDQFSFNPKEKKEIKYRERKSYEKPKVFFIDDKKALQSNIYFYIPCRIDNNERDKAFAKAYNKYFGMGMSSVVFQEVRELRSMAYNAYAYYNTSDNKQNNAYFKGFIGTQADKTTEAINLMDSLIKNFPEKRERIRNLKHHLKQSINTENPGFRNISYLVEKWNDKGYYEDPRIKRYDFYEEITMRQLNVYHLNNFTNSPMIIALVGNSGNIDMEKLKEMGEFIELKEKDVLK